MQIFQYVLNLPKYRVSPFFSQISCSNEINQFAIAVQRTQLQQRKLQSRPFWEAAWHAVYECPLRHQTGISFPDEQCLLNFSIPYIRYCYNNIIKTDRTLTHKIEWLVKEYFKRPHKEISWHLGTHLEHPLYQGG